MIRHSAYNLGIRRGYLPKFILAKK